MLIRLLTLTRKRYLKLNMSWHASETSLLEVHIRSQPSGYTT